VSCHHFVAVLSHNNVEILRNRLLVRRTARVSDKSATHDDEMKYSVTSSIANGRREPRVAQFRGRRIGNDLAQVRLTELEHQSLAASARQRPGALLSRRQSDACRSC